jgi:hypothetical protein
MKADAFVKDDPSFCTMQLAKTHKIWGRPKGNLVPLKRFKDAILQLEYQWRGFTSRGAKPVAAAWCGTDDCEQHGKALIQRRLEKSV